MKISLRFHSKFSVWFNSLNSDHCKGMVTALKVISIPKEANLICFHFRKASDMQKYQGKIEQTVAHPYNMNAFVIPDNIGLTRGWYCENFWFKEKKEKISEKIFVFWIASILIILSKLTSLTKLLFTVYLCVFNRYWERERQKIERAKNSVCRGSPCLYLFKCLGKSCFCHKPICNLENIYFHFFIECKNSMWYLWHMLFLFSCCRTNSIAL